jgi:WhiB family redox-sensing transcriptional regulator
VSALPGRAQARHAATFTRDQLDWQKRARCAGHDPELFFPEKGTPSNSVAAVRICFRCDVQLDCLLYALEHQNGEHGVVGIWGGATEEERKELRRLRDLRKRRKARVP